MPVFYVTLDSSGLVRGVKLAKVSVDSLGGSFDTMKRGGVDAANSVATSLGGLHTALNRLKVLLGGALGFHALKDIVSVSSDIASLEKTFYSLTGSFDSARSELAWLRDESQRLGLDFFSLASSFKGFSAAGKGAGMDAEKVKDVFISVSEAATVLGLDAQKTQRALYALEQMISKGSVSMEELRQQLGDQLPGAFQAAARAMGMTTREFAKLVEKGGVDAVPFLEKLSVVLRSDYGAGLAEALKAPRAEMQRLSNAVLFAKKSIGDSGFLEGVADSAEALRTALDSEEVQRGLKTFGTLLGDATSLVTKLTMTGIENMHVITGMGAAYGAFKISTSETVSSIKNLIGALKNGETSWQSFGRSVTDSGISKAQIAYNKALADQENAMRRVRRADLSAAHFSGTPQEIRAAALLTTERDRLAAATMRLKAAEDQLTAAKRKGLAFSNSMKAAGNSLLGVFGGPVGLAFTAASVGAMYLATAQSDGEKIAERYAQAIASTGDNAEGAKTRLDQYRASVKGLKDEQAAVALRKLQEEMKSTEKEIGKLSASFAADNTRFAAQWGFIPKNTEAQKYSSILDNYRNKTISLVEAQRQLDLVYANGGDEKVYLQIKKQLDARGEQEAQLASLTTHMEQVSASVDSAAFSFQNLFSIMNSLGGAFDSMGAKALDKFASASDSARRENLDASWKQVETYYESERKRLEGDKEALAALTKKYDQAKETYTKQTSSGRGGGLDSRSSDISRFKDEIKQLQFDQLSPTEQIEEQVRDFLAKNYPDQLVEQWRGLKLGSLDAKSFDEANRSLQDFDKQYQQTFKNSGMLTASVTSEMDAFRQAAQVSYGGARGDAQKLEETLRRIDELQAHKLLESSTYWLDGARRGLHTVSEETGNMAKGMEGLITGTFSQISSSFSFTTDGLKFEWKSLLDYMLDQSMKMLVLNPILSGLSGGLSGLFGGGSGLTLGKFASDSLSGANKTLGAVAQSVKFSAKGNVFDAPALSSYSNSIVSSPTIFPFAKGVGLMGEAGDEAIMPLTRTRNGDLGVQVDLGDIRSDWRPRAMPGGSVAPQVNLQVNIENNTSAQVRASATQDTAGNPVLNIQIIEQIDGALAQRVYNGRSSIGQAIDRTRGTSNARMLYRK